MLSPERIVPSKKALKECVFKNRKIVSFKGQDYESLRSQCLKDNKLFEDPFFRAINTSIFYNKHVPHEVKWQRPREISEKPLFIDDEPTAHDLDQGYLGDCK